MRLEELELGLVEVIFGGFFRYLVIQPAIQVTRASAKSVPNDMAE